MSFQLPATTTAASTGGFSFGLSTTAAGAKPGGGFSFGTPNAAPTAAAPAPSLAGFGTVPAATTTPFGGFGTTTTSTAPTGGLGGFGATATPAAAPAPATTLPTLTGFGSTGGFGATSTTTALPTGTLPTLSGFGSTATTSVAKPTIPTLTGFNTAVASTTTTSTSGFTLTKTTAVPTLGLGIASSAPTAPTSTTTAGGFANLTTATKTTDSSSVAHASQVSYNQLEEHINKWTLELEEQEKVFTEQATQINAWDKVLINNNQKILELNDAVQKVKNDQQMLEQELEFIATQHKELEESIAPLQKEFLKIPQVDVERSQTYLMVENLDTQLKQMSEDLKEIIDNLNEANKGQDNTDPIIQIGKILNAHMSSLQWIETSSSNISNKLEDINKMHESFKRDSERSFRSAYYN